MHARSTDSNRAADSVTVHKMSAIPTASTSLIKRLTYRHLPIVVRDERPLCYNGACSVSVPHWSFIRGNGRSTRRVLR